MDTERRLSFLLAATFGLESWNSVVIGKCAFQIVHAIFGRYMRPATYCVPFKILILQKIFGPILDPPQLGILLIGPNIFWSRRIG